LQQYEQIYGSLGGVMALLVWLYISALIILLGGVLIDISSDFFISSSDLFM